MTHHRRKEFTKETQRAARKRSGDRCESRLVPFLVQLSIDCQQRLTVGNCIYDHINADYCSSDNSLSNCACLCKSCNRIKTSQSDAPVIAHVKRVADHHRGIRDSWDANPEVVALTFSVHKANIDTGLRREAA